MIYVCSSLPPVRPLIAYSNPNVESITGRTVQLNCVVLLGNPRPRIMWFKMGEQVMSGGRIQDDQNGNLLIQNVKLGDEGEYTCVASNVGGNATYITQLDVQGRGVFGKLSLATWGYVLKLRSHRAPGPPRTVPHPISDPWRSVARSVTHP